MYGSDTLPISDGLGAEETYWVAMESARSALAAALAEMVSEEEISEQQSRRHGPCLSARYGCRNILRAMRSVSTDLVPREMRRY